MNQWDYTIGVVSKSFSALIDRYAWNTASAQRIRDPTAEARPAVDTRLIDYNVK